MNLSDAANVGSPLTVQDAPPASDGALSQCNTFAPLNASDPSTNFTTLSVPYPSNRLWVSTYYIPLGRINTTAAPWAYIPPIENEEYQGNGKARNGSAPSLDDTSAVSSASAKKNTTLLGGNPAPARVWPANASAFPLGLLSQLPVHSRGLASSGTVELIGRDASEAVIQGGEEGSVRIDVVIQYGGLQAVEGIMRVCGTSNGDSLGVGVYVSLLSSRASLCSICVGRKSSGRLNERAADPVKVTDSWEGPVV